MFDTWTSFPIPHLCRSFSSLAEVVQFPAVSFMSLFPQIQRKTLKHSSEAAWICFLAPRGKKKAEGREEETVRKDSTSHAQRASPGFLSWACVLADRLSTHCTYFFFLKQKEIKTQVTYCTEGNWEMVCALLTEVACEFWPFSADPESLYSTCGSCFSPPWHRNSRAVEAGPSPHTCSPLAWLYLPWPGDTQLFASGLHAQWGLNLCVCRLQALVRRCGGVHQLTQP